MPADRARATFWSGRYHIHFALPVAQLGPTELTVLDQAVRGASGCWQRMELSTSGSVWHHEPRADTDELLRLTVLGFYPALATLDAPRARNQAVREAIDRVISAVQQENGRLIGDAQLPLWVAQAPSRQDSVVRVWQELQDARKHRDFRRCTCDVWTSQDAPHCSGCSRRFSPAQDLERDETRRRAAEIVSEREAVYRALRRGEGVVPDWPPPVDTGNGPAGGTAASMSAQLLSPVPPQHLLPPMPPQHLPPPPPAPRQPSAELLPTQERWGLEYRGDRMPVPISYTERPPRLEVPQLPWAADPVTRAHQARKSRRLVGGWTATGGAALAAAALALGAGPVAALAPVVAAGALTWAAFARSGRVLDQDDATYTDWLATACAYAHVQFRQKMQQWAVQEAAAEQRRRLTATNRPAWSTLRPTATERVDIYGGTTRGWQCLLAAAGGSLLGCGTQLTILDLTGSHVAGPLGTRAGQAGSTQQWLTCPEGITGVNLLAGLPHPHNEAIGAVLGEALRGADPTWPESRVDADIIKQVAEQLTDAPVTIARLYTALKVLLHQVELAKADGLSKKEARAVADLFGQTALRSAEQRLFRLCAYLGGIAALGGSGDGEPLLAERDDLLRVVELSRHLTKNITDLLAQLLFQVLAHRLPSQPNGAVVIVAGADCLPRDQVEWLDQRARSLSIRLILMFRHLREDAVDLLGGGDAVIFMRLSNAREAEHAATFIGKEHRFVASQFTVSRSDNTSASTTNTSTTTNSLGHYGSATESRADTDQQGSSTGESVSFQRVNDYTVSPTWLQGMSDTAFIQVDSCDPGSPRLGECDPAVLSDPTLLPDPAIADGRRAEPPDRRATE